MSEVRPTYDDEIDLFELFATIWDGKWKIIAITAVFVVAAVGFKLSQSQADFTATTEIKPITSLEAEKYRASNALGFFPISRTMLLDLYIEQLEERALFEEAIARFNLIDKKDFQAESDYELAVIEMVNSIELLPPANVDGSEKGPVRLYWTFVAKYNDYEKWKDFIAFVNDAANSSVHRVVNQRFDDALSQAQRQRNFEIEDVTILIENALLDYKRKTEDRLAFLGEQAAIARTLGVAKNTIEAQMFSGQGGMVTNVKTESPFYLRGYEAIEKEIELIKSRKDPRAFVSDLLDLEQKKRALEQDKLLERAAQLFALTPVIESGNYVAVNVSVDSTDFESNDKTLLMLALSAVLGGMIGVIYVLIAGAARNRKEKLKAQ